MAQTLQNCVIALSGSFYADAKTGYSHQFISYLIRTHGGRYERKITADFKQALNRPTVKIVCIKWLQDSIDRQTLEDETPYLMVNVIPAIAANNGEKGGKRSHGGMEEQETEAEETLVKKQKMEQNAKPKKLHVPVDEGCALKYSHHVYIAKDGTIFDANLNQTDLATNANKFYRIQLLKNKTFRKLDLFPYSVWTCWGRVGERGHGVTSDSGLFEIALKGFQKKFKEKTGIPWDSRFEHPIKGKYTVIERNFEEDSEDENELPGARSRRGSKESNDKSDIEREIVQSTLPHPVQELMQVVFNKQYFTEAMAAMSYDSNMQPLGKLSGRILKLGYEKLKELAALIANSDLAEELYHMPYQSVIDDLSSSYYTYIPHCSGRHRLPMIDNHGILRKEVKLLESLSDMSIADDIMKEAKEDSMSTLHPLDRQYALLGMAEMTPLNRRTTEFKEIHDYLMKAHGDTHTVKFKVQEIFRIERDGEADRFNQSPFATIESDRRLLWHGSRCTNFGGILSQGLRIAPPEAPATGYMFGKGVYLADISSKSAHYCDHDSSGGIGLLLLCEAELGKPMLTQTDACYNADELTKKHGHYSTWGMGKMGPVGWKDAGCVNENLKGVLMPDTSSPPTRTNVEDPQLQYNEYICYDVAQIRLRYLLRVKMT